MLTLYTPSGTLLLVILGIAKQWRHRRRSMAGVWFPFLMYVFICAHDPFPAWVVLASVRYREIFRRDTIARYQSSKFRLWMRYVDISYLVISHGMGYLYHDIIWLGWGWVGLWVEFIYLEISVEYCALDLVWILFSLILVRDQSILKLVWVWLCWN